MRLPWQVTAMVSLATVVGIMVLPGIVTNATPKPTLTNTHQATPSPTFVIFPNAPTADLHHPQVTRAAINDVEWAPDGSMLAASFTYHDIEEDRTKHDVVIWDAQSHKLLQILTDHGPPFAWSPDGKELASYTRAVGITVWDVQAEAEVRTMGNMPDDIDEDTRIPVRDLERVLKV
ncbi:MAG: WD40 repeat domain-containing protein [Anaerolineae bacterium]|nr:WD40 repeat domain-containing protein [Anaerolineae bacterium]